MVAHRGNVYGTKQLKQVVVPTLGVLLLLWAATVSTIIGGTWSIATTQPPLPINSTIPVPGEVTFVFGLTQYRLYVGDKMTEAHYAEELAKPNIAAQTRIDYEDAIVGGTWASAMVELGTVALSVSVVLHLCMWPLDKFPMLHKLAFPSVLLAGTCFFFGVIIWSSMGHAAVEHITVNHYGEVLPVLYFGWCFNLMVFIMIITFVASGLSWCVQKRASLGPGLGENYLPSNAEGLGASLTM
jgi:hypothetical protein